MNTSACFSCQDRLSCDDSGLSITGNIIGILTFIFAIAISISVWFNSIRNAERSIADLAATLDSQLSQLRSLDTKLQVLRERSGDNDGSNDHGEEMLKAAVKRIEDPLSDAQVLFGKVWGNDGGHGARAGRSYGRQRWFQFLTRAKFVRQEEKFRDVVRMLEKPLEDMKEVAALRSASEESRKRAMMEEDYHRQVLEMMAKMNEDILGLKEDILHIARQE